jgi:hypothetical protein
MNINATQLESLKAHYFAKLSDHLEDVVGLTVKATANEAVAFHYPDGDVRLIRISVISPANAVEIAWEYGGKIKVKKTQNPYEIEKILREACKDTGLPAMEVEVIYDRRKHQRLPGIITFFMQKFGLETVWERRKIKRWPMKLTYILQSLGISTAWERRKLKMRDKHTDK